ncbi:MAG TPA: transposase family protein [Vicinamibacterales bacterium]|nr:transposase family protein [Vicinamibacterales bacterium]
MGSTIKVKVGAIVQARNTNYRVTQILSLDELAGLNLETHKTELIKVGDLTFQPSEEQRKHGRPDVRRVSDTQWTKAEEQYDEISKLAAMPGRSLEDVTKAAKALNMSVTTVYRRISAVEVLDSPLAMLRRTQLEEPSLGFDILPEGQSPATLDEVVVYVARETVKNHVRYTGVKFCSEVLKKCKALKLDEPHPNTVRNVMNRLEPGIRIAILKGRKASLRLEVTPGEFSDSEIPYHTFQIDHTPLNVMVVDTETRKPIGRAWITAIIELYSRVVPGFAVSLDGPSSASVSSAIRHAILPKDNWLRERGIEMKWPIFGKPVVIHADNAKEFRGNILRRVCKSYGMDLNWRPVKKPRFGGYIERLMGTLASILKDVAGTTYSNPEERQEYDSERNAIMTLDELERWLAYRIGVIYHRTEHTGIHNQTPLGRLTAAITGTEDKPGIGWPPLVDDPRRLYLDFLPRFNHAIQPTGVKIEYVKYFDDALRPFVGIKEPSNPRKSRKWDFARDDRQISPIYFFNPRTSDYEEIPYANLSRPPISVWELKAAKKYLREEGRDPKNESEIFRAHTKLKEIESSAEKQTKVQRQEAEKKLRRQKSKKEDDALPGSQSKPAAPSVGDDAAVSAPEGVAAPAPAPRVRKIFQIEELP